MDPMLGNVQPQFLGFLMVFIRVVSILFFAPVFGSENIPAQVKVPFALIMALVLTGSLGFPALGNLENGWIPAVAGELLIGISIGFVGWLIMNGVQAGGEVVGMQMGFGIVNVIDPNSDISISLVGQFYSMIAMLVFLAINGHHVVIEALRNSFTVIPPGQMRFSTFTSGYLIEASGMVLAVAVRVAAPVIVALFLVSLTTGVIARTIPQINFLIVGFAFRIAVGMIMLLFGLVFYVGMVNGLFEDMSVSFFALMRTFALK